MDKNFKKVIMKYRTEKLTLEQQNKNDVVLFVKSGNKLLGVLTGTDIKRFCDR